MSPNIKPLMPLIFRSILDDRTTVFSWAMAVAVFAGLLAILLYFRPITLVIAVSRSDVAELKIAQLLVDHTRSKSSRLRLSVLQTQSPEDALRMLELGKAEMAIGRSDMTMPESATSVAILKPMQPFFALPTQVPLTKKGLATEATPEDLKGKLIGYSDSLRSNRTLLEAILRHWQLLDVVTLVPIPTGQLVPLAKSSRIDALFTVNAASSDATGTRVLDTLNKAFPNGFTVLTLADSTALMGKIPGLEDGTIARGVFRASPALPLEDLTSAAITSNLIVSKDISNDTIATTVKALIAMKEAQLARNPDLSNIAEPSKTNRNIAFNSVAAKVHDGTYEDFFDLYANKIYIGLALVGGIASLGGGAYRRQRMATTTELSSDLRQLLALQESFSKPMLPQQRRNRTLVR